MNAPRRHIALLGCLLLLVAAPARGQLTDVEPCATETYNAMLEQQDPSLASRRQAIERQIQNLIAGPSVDGTIYTIPVVFHVVYNQGFENLSTSQLQSQIDVLNEDFRRMNANAASTPAIFQGVAADLEIEFCLASMDPQGQPTTGITRTPTSVTSFSSSSNAVKFTSQGGRDAWPSGQYLNIWVCDIQGLVIGYATFPGGSPSIDGVVMDYAAVGRFGSAQFPYNQGRTCVHEVGHWLNLFHIWGPTSGGCGQDDFVADTPNCSGPHYGCPSSFQCGSQDMVQNYMDYSDDSCMNLFTQGQKARCRAVLGPGGPRQSLQSSLACGVPPSYQVNQSGALTFIDGQTGNADVPASVTHCYGQVTFMDFQSQVVNSLPYDVAFVPSALLAANGGGGLTTPGNQLVNINTASPSLFFLSTGTSAPGLPPWSGNFSLPYLLPSFPVAWGAQMIKVDTVNPEGFALSAPFQLIVVPGSPLPAGPAGNESSVTVNLVASCAPPIVFYGTTYTQMHVSSNGRVLFGGPDVDLSPTVAEALTDNAAVGMWADLDPSSGGSVDITQPSPDVIRVAWNAVPFPTLGPTTPVSFAIEFDTSNNSVAIDGLLGITAPMTAQWLGMSPGGPGGAVDPGQITFTPGGSGTYSPTQMIHDYCQGNVFSPCSLASFATGLDRVTFTPFVFGGYTWVGF